jgi:hypothetical protein
MKKYINDSNSTYILIGLFVLYNLLFLSPRIAVMRLPADDLVVNWATLQYFFSYNIEFMKRGLMGTIFDIFSIQPTLKVIWFFSLLFANIAFFLIYNLLKMLLKDLQNSNKWIIVLLFLFTISPATAWNFGYEAGRADLFNLVIELIIINIIIYNNRSIYFVIPFLLVVGILIHEAFLFMSIPVVLALLLDKFMNKQVPLSVMIGSFIAISCTAVAILLYGKIDPGNLASMYESIYHKPLPEHLPTINTFMIVTSSLSTNVLFTLREYFTFHVWKYFLAVLPLLASYIYIYFKPVNFASLSVEKKVLFLSPFLIFPMFIFGVDIYRWFSMILINMFIVTIYFISSKIITLSVYNTRSIRIAIFIVLLYSFAGALGARTSLPYISILFNRIL